MTDDTGYKSVLYSELFAPLINVVKELYAMITGQDKRLEDQTRRIASIDDDLEKANLKIENLESQVIEKNRELCAKKILMLLSVSK